MDDGGNGNRVFVLRWVLLRIALDTDDAMSGTGWSCGCNSHRILARCQSCWAMPCMDGRGFLANVISVILLLTDPLRFGGAAGISQIEAHSPAIW